jgi:twitching motility protein PilT
MAIVSQREVGADTPGVAEALRRVSRQDGDVVFVSDLPDVASVRGALAAASSGRLVLAITNTLSATDTLDGLVDRFEPHQQGSVRQTLGRVLRGVICQRLVDRADGRGRVAVVEALVGTQKVREAIAGAADPAVLERLMAEGDYHGMATSTRPCSGCSPTTWCRSPKPERASHPEDFRVAVAQAGLATLR